MNTIYSDDVKSGYMKQIFLFVFSLTSTSLYAYDSNPYTAASAVYKVEIQEGNLIHLGTGILIARDKILTNCHVVQHSGIFRVIHQQSKEVFPTTLYYNLGNYDACILKGNFTKGTPVEFFSHFEIGETVWHFGYPGNVFGFGQGPILGLVPTKNGLVIESGSFCNPGSSGGPLFNVKGKLIALNFGVRSEGTRNKCLSIPISDLLPFIKI